MPVALALSPHLDDAAFSAGATLAALANKGWDVTVATLFTASVPNPTGFALACQLDKGIPPGTDYMAIRRAEDAEACAILGARPAFLPLREAPHRGYCGAAALFGPVRPDDAAHVQAAPLLRDLIARLTPTLILAPQAIGGHVDHVQLLRALSLVAPTAPVWFWEDQPYASRPGTHPARPFEDGMARLDRRETTGDAATKLAACLCYASQLRFQFGGADGVASLGGAEVFRTRPALAQAA
ncbi:MAG: PIG-L family deacetylase [Acetobacteraceae bacterium]|nr:PIG-L family deacetylase [Acetobacteraceae bacterium]